MRRIRTYGAGLTIAGVVLSVVGYSISMPWNCFPDPCIANPNYIQGGYLVEVAGLISIASGLFAILGQKWLEKRNH